MSTDRTTNRNHILEDNAMNSAQEFYGLEELKRFPTISNQVPAEKLSARYGFVPTIRVAEALYSQGWKARAVVEQVVKNPALQGTQKHMIRFALDKSICMESAWQRAFNRAGLQLEIIFFGSHDGSTKFKLFLGFLRFICFNETITGDMLEQFCFVHRSGAPIKAESAINAVTGAVPKLGNQIRKLQYTTMTDSEMYAYGKRAIELKHGDGWFNDHRLDVWDFMKPTRSEDSYQSVFNVYNRCQERLTQGGYKYVSEFKQTPGRINAEYLPGINKTAKAVKNLDVTLKLNQGLWQQATEFGEYLSA